MRRISRRAGLALLFSAALAPFGPGARAAGRDAAEAIFRGARAYTVRIRTEIVTPFAEDSRGAFMGAGFVVDASRGWVLTNAHVVGQSPSTVLVAFADEPFVPTRKIYVDSFTDVAVVAIEVKGRALRAAPLDCSETPNVGESVGAFGHPLGLLFTGSRGIVSGRTDQIGPDLLQIDATVDHGNSGGPVIRLRDGRVVGIATAGAGGQRSDRVNFATPMKDVCRILDLLKAGVAPDPPKMPFSLLVNEDGSHTLQVGCTFDSTRWPFEPGDRIVSLPGREGSLKTLSDLVTALRGRPGPVPLLVERQGKRVQIEITPERRAPVLERRAAIIDGALIAPAAFEDAPALREAAEFMIQSVEPGSAAEGLGLGQQDILDTFDGHRFESLQLLMAYLRQHPRGTPIRLVLRRWSGAIHGIFDYHVRELPGEDVRFVGVEEPVASDGR